MAASKNKGARKQRKRRRRGPIAGLIRWSIALSGGALLVYIVYLDFRVQLAFEGKRWAIPARVYAQPLELYSGLAVSPEKLADHLRTLHYRKAVLLDRPGTFQRRGSDFELVTRPFHFWDGEEPSHHLTLRVADGRITAMRAINGPQPGLVRLDPALIAGIYPSHNEDRVLVKREEIPEPLIHGLIAVEDQSFYSHNGIDPRGIARALWANVRAGRTVQGGSTLTQQLVKNFFLTSERTLERKAVESLMALIVEAHYDKDEILEAYANEVYLGQDGKRAIHGFGLGSHFYFQRPLEELELQHIALLVGLVKGPSYYDPRKHADRAKARRNLVLDLMASEGAIDAGTAERAARLPLGVSPRTRGGITRYPAFLDLVRRQLERDYREADLTSEGLRIFTTLNLSTQHALESALEGGLPILEKRHGLPADSLQGAAVFTDPQTGEVIALVGSRDVKTPGFNRALDARRPIGSLIKPFVYLEALSHPDAYNLISPLNDGPLSVKLSGGRVWSPQNYDREFHGTVALRDALAHSYNAATARLGLELGVERVVESLERMGIDRKIQPYPSLLLGAADLTPFEVAGLYQVLATGGFRTPLRAIREVVGANGEPLQRYPITVRQVSDPGAVYLLTTAMQRVITDGTGRTLLQKVPDTLRLAGKTGTSDDKRDSWFAAFSGDVLGVIWLGRDDNGPAGLSGSSGALRIYGDAARDIGLMPLQPIPPSGVEMVWVDQYTGGRSAPNCAGSQPIPFLGGYTPRENSPCLGGFRGYSNYEAIQDGAR